MQELSSSVQQQWQQQWLQQQLQQWHQRWRQYQQQQLAAAVAPAPAAAMRSSATSAAAVAAAADIAPERLPATVLHEAPVEEAEGLRLHLSSRSITGYKGVYVQPRSGRFEARRKVEGKDVCLGTFDMAVEAAVAYARSVALAQPVHCTPITRRPASFDARLNALERVVQARMAQEMPISPITRVDHCEASAAAPTFSSQGIALLEAAVTHAHTRGRAGGEHAAGDGLVPEP
uniref:AP2/ERF domain-containing protein n=1 Tax=Emiliania huxleyi TaxID=2903 RepID=A0A7S3SYS9_EMIHU|mmetsp:Transcript_35385/g.104921  ORF Transcript_35385/g.104921 Transcript_35385/m.104921 type:complete len:232 (+) Transcript_35385:156-851(+)